MTKVETGKKEKYLVALLTSSTKAEAYKAAHISKATANRIEQEPDFIEQYNKIRRQAMEQTSNKLQGLAAKAVDTLASVMDSEQATPTERTRAAKIVRDGQTIFTGTIDQLKRFKDDVKEVATGFECGISFAKFNDLQEGDIIEVSTTEEVERQELV